MNITTRHHELLKRFAGLYGGRGETRLLSVPGRSEIGGNHTDHNNGLALAAAVDLDIVGAAARSAASTVRVWSAGHPEITIDIGALEPREEEKNTAAALVRGVCAYFSRSGYPIGGFDAVTTSDVSAGSGLSSSAAFSVLAGAILGTLYGAGTLEPMELALAGRFAENRYFGKPSGMLDQTTCAYGGVLSLDFGTDTDSGAPKIRRLSRDFNEYHHKLCVTGPIGSHEDLTEEYAAIPREMRMVAGRFGAERLREVDEAEFTDALPRLYAELPGRAVLRAMHFFAENRRAGGQITALEAGDFDTFLSLVRQSGRSSFMYLQNVYHGGEQGLALALALSEQLLGGRGAARVHGGGFAGTIQAFVPDDMLNVYTRGMERVFGDGTCRVLEIRNTGAAVII